MAAKTLKITIANKVVDVQSVENAPVSISYKLEDREDFQKKESSKALSIVLPATVTNQEVANSFHDPAVEDLTSGESFRNPETAVITVNDYELLVGKAFLKSAGHTNVPTKYEYDLYGSNADWIIALQEKNLFDFLKDISFPLTKQGIIDSWAFDGRSELLPYVFAPVRYGQPMAEGAIFGATETTKDYNMQPEYMRPSISKYWLLYKAFKSLGYQISSEFFDTDYFRRQVMPWTWGNFLFSDGTRLTDLDFLAKSVADVTVWNYSFTGDWDLNVSNDSTNGAFDNNNTYQFIQPDHKMSWKYPTLAQFDYGILEATFHFAVFVNATATANSDVEFRIKWFKNGALQNHPGPNNNFTSNGTLLVNLDAPSVGRRDFVGIVDDWFTATVKPGDLIEAIPYLHTFDSGSGRANILANVNAFELDYFRIPLGGTIDFQNYSAFKKHKILDFIRGITDEFDLIPTTDSIKKVVYFEPAHDYDTSNDLSGFHRGHFNSNTLDWQTKQDISKESTLENYSDAEREQIFKYKDDSADGILKLIQDRNNITVASSKYLLSPRFKTGKKEIENRFFSPVMHYDVRQWTGIGGSIDTQMICLVPENVSNTSKDEAQNTFAPKSAYYKGNVANGMYWIFDNVVQNHYPFMFAVNYKAGGEDDPILSYSDERIGEYPNAVVGKGLMRRFFLQRMAITRHGKFYETQFRLNDSDVMNFRHREHILCSGQKWELVEVNQYKPLKDESTGCFLRMWKPVTQDDADNVFPSNNAVMETVTPTNSFDQKYAQLKCLPSDISSS